MIGISFMKGLILDILANIMFKCKSPFFIFLAILRKYMLLQLHTNENLHMYYTW